LLKSFIPRTHGKHLIEPLVCLSKTSPVSSPLSYRFSLALLSINFPLVTGGRRIAHQVKRAEDGMTSKAGDQNGIFRGTFGAELFYAVYLCAFCSFLQFLRLAGKSFIF